jgi:hypothetical protein
MITSINEFKRIVEGSTHNWEFYWEDVNGIEHKAGERVMRSPKDSREYRALKLKLNSDEDCKKIGCRLKELTETQ